MAYLKAKYYQVPQWSVTPDLYEFCTEKVLLDQKESTWFLDSWAKTATIHPIEFSLFHHASASAHR